MPNFSKKKNITYSIPQFTQFPIPIHPQLFKISPKIDFDPPKFAHFLSSKLGEGGQANFGNAKI